MKSIGAQAFRFLLVGCANTLATYVVYLALLNFTGYRIAFSFAFVVGIFIAYTLNSYFVFKAKLSLRAMLQYPLVYVFQYFSTLLLLALLVDYFRFDQRIAPLVTVVFLAPPTFLLNRWFLLRETLKKSVRG